MSSGDGVVLGVIPARGGSRRVPRKNIKLLGNKPLIAWSIEAAQKAKTLDYFLVSTGDEEIARLSKVYGARVPFKRPKKLRGDVDSSLVIKHAVEWFESEKGKRVDYVVTIQPTSPFRTSEDIDTCVNIARASGVESVISIKKASEHPFWCLTLKPFGHEVEPFLNDIKLEGDLLVSQKLPLALYPNGAVYVTRRDVIMSGRLFGRHMYAYMMPRIRSVDLEEEYDFYVASALIPILKKEEPYAQISWMIP